MPCSSLLKNKCVVFVLPYIFSLVCWKILKIKTRFPKSKKQPFCDRNKWKSTNMSTVRMTDYIC